MVQRKKMVKITEELFNIIRAAVKKISGSDLNFKLDIPKNKNFGDYSTNAAHIIAKQIKKTPKEAAEIIINNFEYDKNLIDKIEIAGNGFINFFISDSFYYDIINEIIELKENFGKTNSHGGETANIEWVSANPTGLLHAGHGRQVALGKVIANLLEWEGYDITREYYYNDAGNQMLNLAKSIQARYIQKTSNPDFPFPEDGYHGETVIDIVNLIIEKHGTNIDTNDIEFFKDFGENYNFTEIKNTLKKFNISHDIFFNETDLYKSGEIDNVLNKLSEKNLLEEKDGAKWMVMDKSKGFDKNKVLVKSTGEYTYRLPDIAYHINKIKRGYDLMLDIFGSDHKDTYREVLYGVESLGYNTEKIKVIIHQMVTFKSGDERIKMSKRSDNVYYLNDLIDDVGIDAAQFYFVMRAANTHLDFDVQLAKEQSDKNPVFYLQYAYARICGIIRNYEEISGSFNYGNITGNFQKFLITEEEITLIKTLYKFPEEVKSAAENFEPHKIINYLNEVAENFHRFYHNHRVINQENKVLSESRLALCLAVKQILKNGFDIIGISAPERM
jgi:arginyl-tRNA synthetase